MCRRNFMRLRKLWLQIQKHAINCHEKLRKSSAPSCKMAAMTRATKRHMVGANEVILGLEVNEFNICLNNHRCARIPTHASQSKPKFARVRDAFSPSPHQQGTRVSRENLFLQNMATAIFSFGAHISNNFDFHFTHLAIPPLPPPPVTTSINLFSQLKFHASNSVNNGENFLNSATYSKPTKFKMFYDPDGTRASSSGTEHHLGCTEKSFTPRFPFSPTTPHLNSNNNHSQNKENYDPVQRIYSNEQSLTGGTKRKCGPLVDITDQMLNDENSGPYDAKKKRWSKDLNSARDRGVNAQFHAAPERVQKFIDSKALEYSNTAPSPSTYQPPSRLAQPPSNELKLLPHHRNQNLTRFR